MVKVTLAIIPNLCHNFVHQLTFVQQVDYRVHAMVCTQWVAKGPYFLHVDIIFVGYIMLWLNFFYQIFYQNIFSVK